MQRPTAVTVIGWVFIGFGALAAFSGLLALSVSLLNVFVAAPAPHATAGMPPPFRLMTRIFDFFWAIAALQLVVAALMIWAGAAFLRLKAWARVVLEILSWLALVYNVGFGIFWLWSVWSLGGQVPSNAGAARLVPYFMMSFGAVIIIVFSVPLIIIIRVLRGETVRRSLSV